MLPLVRKPIAGATASRFPLARPEPPGALPDAEGLGVAQDYTEAARWYRSAAEQGDANAQASLAMMYASGTP